MNVSRTLRAIALATVLLTATALHAGEEFTNAIKTGEDFRKQKRYPEAIDAFDTAVKFAFSDTDTALALGKKAFVQAYDLKDYKAARASLEKALPLTKALPVARVTVLQVQAECLIKADKDYKAAAIPLEEAVKLQGVSWAMPGVNLMLGDAYRFTERYKEALEAYKRVCDQADVSNTIRAVAFLNTGITNQYHLRSAAAAKEAYTKAAELEPKLKPEIDQHLSTLR